MTNLIRICVPYLSHEPNTRRAPHGATTQARTRLNVTAAALAALLLAAAVATTAVLAPRPAQAQTTPNPSVCNRTPQIRDAIVDAISGVTNCTDVTSAHLTSIQELDASGTGLRTLQAGDFNGMTGLTTLWLSQNLLSSVPATIFSGLTALEWIQLGYNQLNSLDRLTFNGLTNLENIYLRNNRLSSLDKDTFNGLSSIEGIYIQENDIMALDKDTLSGLTTLERFYAWGNGFGNVHKDTFNGLIKLEELLLMQNGITELHEDTFDGLSALTTLAVGSNLIRELDKDIFDGLSALTILAVNDNRITALDEDIFDGLSSLNLLALQRNKLTTLPTGIFSGLTSLTTLSLSGNDQMTSLPSNVFAGLSALEDLRMESLDQHFVWPDGLLQGLTNLNVFHAGDPERRFWNLFRVELVRTPGSDGEAKLRVPLGAPFNMQFYVRVEGDDSPSHSGLRRITEHPITITTGTTESEAFILPTEPDPDIPHLVNNDGEIVVQLTLGALDDDDWYCGSNERPYRCYRGFIFSNYVFAPDSIEVASVSPESARIVWNAHDEDLALGHRYFYIAWILTGDSYSYAYSGFHDPTATNQQSLELQSLAPDQEYWVYVYGLSDDGILSMYREPRSSDFGSAIFLDFARASFRTAKQPSTGPPVVSVGSNYLTLAWMPQASFQALTSNGPRDVAIQGYQVRYKKTAEAMSAYSQWQTIETETTADGRQTTTLDWLFVSQLVGGELYDIQLRTITGFSGYVDPTPGYSEPATTTILTFIPVPGVNRVEPATPEVSVRAGDRIRLSADIYNAQDILDNDDAENGEGAFKKWQPELEWTSSGAGSFDDASGRRSIVYTAPSLPGLYTVTAEVGPPGLCRAHHPGVEEQDGDPCMAQFTLRVSREAEAPTPGPGPVNPAFMIPPRVTDDAGIAFSVFTPVEGGTFSGTGITVSARPGAVPDRAVLALAATEAAAVAPSSTQDSEFNLHGNAYDVIGMSRTGGAGFTAVTEYRLDEPLTACLQVPWDQLDNLSNITVVEIRSDGLVGPLTSNLRTADGTTAACGRFSRVPATLAIATRADAASGTTVVPTAATTQQELPEAGGSSPTVSILALVLLSGLATVAVAVAAAVAMRARRPAHTRARE